VLLSVDSRNSTGSRECAGSGGQQSSSKVRATQIDLEGARLERSSVKWLQYEGGGDSRIPAGYAQEAEV